MFSVSHEKKIQKSLLDQKATLIYYRDVKYTDAAFNLVQRMGLKGYLPEWEARLSDPVTKETLATWNKLSGLKLGEENLKLTRGQLLEKIAK